MTFDPPTPLPTTTTTTTAAGGITGKTILLAGIGVAALAGAGIAAAALLLPQPTQPQDVLPRNTLAVAVVDLDPSLGQKVNLARLVSSLPDDSTITGNVNPDDPIGSLITDPQTKARWDQIAPWIGSKAAIALLPDRNGELDTLIAIEITNEAEARTWLDSESDDLLSDTSSALGLNLNEPLDYTIRDGYALISTDPYLVDRAATTTETLAQNPDFASDRSALGDQIIWGWIDAGTTAPLVKDTLTAAWGDSLFAPDVTFLDNVTGRLMFGLAAQPSDIELTLLSQGVRIDELTEFGDLQFLNDSPLANDVPANALLGIGHGGLSITLDSVASELTGLGDTIDATRLEALAATPLSVYAVPLADSEDPALLIRVPVEATNTIEPFIDEAAQGTPLVTIETNEYLWIGIGGPELTTSRLQEITSSTGGPASELASSTTGGLTSFIDFHALTTLDLGDLDGTWEPGSTATLAISTGPNPGDARITQRFTFNAIIGAVESASPTGTLNRNSSEAALTSVSEAIVRNANAIAATSMNSGGDVQQEHLAAAIYEALGDPLPTSYEFTGLGAGDNPGATLNYTDSGLTCTVTIGKQAPTDTQVTVTSPATCTTS